MSELMPESKPVFEAAIHGDGCGMDAALHSIPLKDWEAVLKNVDSVFKQIKDEEGSVVPQNLQIIIDHNSKDQDKMHFNVGFSSDMTKFFSSLILSESVDIKNQKTSNVECRQGL